MDIARASHALIYVEFANDAVYHLTSNFSVHRAWGQILAFTPYCWNEAQLITNVATGAPAYVCVERPSPGRKLCVPCGAKLGDAIRAEHAARVRSLTEQALFVALEPSEARTAWSGVEPHAQKMRCPFCGHDAIERHGVYTVPGGGRGTVLRMQWACAYGHAWEVCLRWHKGQESCWIEPIPVRKRQGQINWRAIFAAAWMRARAAARLRRARANARA
jgi:hypothetical protein